MLKRLWSDEKGQGMVEYGLILAGIAIVVMVAINLLGPAVANMFNNVTNELEKP